MSKKEKKKHGLGKFLAGASIGAALGVLFAPKKGSETRRELKQKIDELLEKLKNVDAEEVKQNIEAKIYQIKTDLSELDKEKVLKIAKKKATQIKDMAEELVEYAKEKGTPILEEASSSVRQKAIEVTREILNKLESKQKED